MSTQTQTRIEIKAHPESTSREDGSGDKPPEIHLRNPKNWDKSLCGIALEGTATWRQFSENPCRCCVQKKQGS